MKDVLTQDELNQVIGYSKMNLNSKQIEALKMCLVQGHSNRYAMEKTGIHRNKIAEANKAILNDWREMIALCKLPLKNNGA